MKAIDLADLQRARVDLHAAEPEHRHHAEIEE